MPEIVAKTQNPPVADDTFNELSVPSRLDSIDNIPDEMALCPVRALWLYVKRARQFTPGCRCLFISTSWNKKEESKNSIAFWLCKVIKRVYHSWTEKIHPLDIELMKLEEQHPPCSSRGTLPQTRCWGLWSEGDRLPSPLFIWGPLLTNPRITFPWVLWSLLKGLYNLGW